MKDEEKYLEDEMEKFGERWPYPSSFDGYDKDWVDELAEECAKHFYELGKTKQKEQDEEEQADLFTIVALDAAQRAREQMMKEAIHYVVQDDLDPHGASYNIPFIRIGTTALKPKGIGVGDKVRIIIVKED